MKNAYLHILNINAKNWDSLTNKDEKLQEKLFWIQLLFRSIDFMLNPRSIETISVKIQLGPGNNKENEISKSAQIIIKNITSNLNNLFLQANFFFFNKGMLYFTYPHD